MLQMYRLFARHKSMTNRILDKNIVYLTVVYYSFLLIPIIVFAFESADQQPVGDINQ